MILYFIFFPSFSKGDNEREVYHLETTTTNIESTGMRIGYIHLHDELNIERRVKERNKGEQWPSFLISSFLSKATIFKFHSLEVENNMKFFPTDFTIKFDN